MGKLDFRSNVSVKEAYKEKATKDDTTTTPEATTSSSAMGFSHSELHALDDKGLGMIHHAVVSGKNISRPSTRANDVVSLSAHVSPRV